MEILFIISIFVFFLPLLLPSFLIIMTLAGKISTEIGVHATAAKWFDLYATKLHHVQNLAERVHGTKLHRGHDWHHSESIKHWTYVIGKLHLTLTICNPKLDFSFNLNLNMIWLSSVLSVLIFGPVHYILILM